MDYLKRAVESIDFKAMYAKDQAKKDTKEQERHHKQRSRVRFHKAKRDGKVVQLPCDVCDNPKSEAHHPDYNEPLAVTWLCRRHHAQLHCALDGTRSKYQEL
jgi:hypothetical protein